MNRSNFLVWFEWTDKFGEYNVKAILAKDIDSARDELISSGKAKVNDDFQLVSLCQNVIKTTIFNLWNSD